MSKQRDKDPIPEGWYQSPGESSLDRYWDGQSWTSRSRPRARAGLQPASPDLIEHDSGRHPMTWVAVAFGVALLIAAIFTWSSPAHLVGTLLGATGCLVLSASTALLELDLPPRIFSAVSIALGIVFLVAALIAAITGVSAAWVTVLSALVLLAVNCYKVLRPAPQGTDAASREGRSSGERPLG